MFIYSLIKSYSCHRPRLPQSPYLHQFSEAKDPNINVLFWFLYIKYCYHWFIIHFGRQSTYIYIWVYMYIQYNTIQYILAVDVFKTKIDFDIFEEKQWFFSQLFADSANLNIYHLIFIIINLFLMCFSFFKHLHDVLNSICYSIFSFLLLFFFINW